jgi:hypothetical protein
MSGLVAEERLVDRGSSAQLKLLFMQNLTLALMPALWFAVQLGLFFAAALALLAGVLVAR